MKATTPFSMLERLIAHQTPVIPSPAAASPMAKGMRKVLHEMLMAKLFDLEESGYFYTRLQNPTNEAVAAKIAALEGGVAAMLTSSGQAASFFAFFNICEAGDHIVSATSIYGGTYNLLAVTFQSER